ncbi:cytochrome P450 [Xylaria sp. FL1777]|nr:cytochrome P450 [Xylaria sp. FL1777]
MTTLVAYSMLLLLLLLLLTLVYFKLQYKRFEEHRGIPQLPPSLLWGNLKTLYNFLRLGKLNRHPDYIFCEMLKVTGWPQLLLLDIWPFRSPLLVVASHEISEQLSKPTESFPFGSPKMPTMATELGRLLGAKSVITASDEEWRTIRKKYNPAFSHQQALGYTTLILEKVNIFFEKLDTIATSGIEFELLQLCLSFSFDVIVKIVLGLDANAQHPVPDQLSRDYLELLHTYQGLLAITPGWMVPLIDFKRYRTEKSVNKAIKKHINNEFYEKNRQSLDTNNNGRSVLSQVLQHVDKLTPEILSETCDQVKSLFLAGRDTTGTTIAWGVYELSVTPHALKGVREEAGVIFNQPTNATHLGSRMFSAGAGSQDLLGKMPYTHAVVKETLRLHPPGGAMRYSKKGTGFTVRDSSTGKTHCLDGLAIYLCMPAIHRNPDVYGENAELFSPERWMNHAASPKIPSTAWRPFERGPRGCIGQEFAMTEICLVLALLSQRYDFNKTGPGETVLSTQGEPILDGKTGRYKVTEGLYDILEMTPKPVDGMRMRVGFADRNKG